MIIFTPDFQIFLRYDLEAKYSLYSLKYFQIIKKKPFSYELCVKRIVHIYHSHKTAAYYAKY